MSLFSKKDGTSFNYATLGAPADLNFGNDTDFSVSFWTRFTNWTGDPAWVGNKSWLSGGNQGWVTATAGNGRLQWNLGDGAAGGRTRKDYDGPPGTLSDGNWHHVTVTFSRNGDGISYLDGVPVSTNAVAGDLDSLDTPAGLATNIGQDGAGTYTDNSAVGITDGQIDDLAIWRRAVTAQEVSAIHARGLQGAGLIPAPPSAAAPAIQVSRGSSSLTISWPSSTDGFTLEFTDALGVSTNWQPVPGVANNSVTAPITGGARYYRLKK